MGISSNFPRLDNGALCYYNKYTFALVGKVYKKELNSDVLYNFVPDKYYYDYDINNGIQTRDFSSDAEQENIPEKKIKKTIRIDCTNQDDKESLEDILQKQQKQKDKCRILYIRGYLTENKILDKDINEKTDFPYQISVIEFFNNSEIVDKSEIVDNSQDPFKNEKIIRCLFKAANNNRVNDDIEEMIKQALLKKAYELDPILQYQINYDKRLRKDYEQFFKYFNPISDPQNGYHDDIKALLDIASNPLIANKISESTREYEELSGDEKYEKAAYSFITSQPPTIAGIINTIGDKRPNYSCDFIKNVLICIAQNFITIFAGQPGTGKTSLCDIIASALDLDKCRCDNLDMSRYISVSVERGWNSKSELIGYFNALSGRYDDSGIGIYHALKVLHYEYEENLNTPPFFILLDEANLSPVEHYWSEFMKLADMKLADVSELHKGCRGEIPIGGGEKLKVSNNLRFLATVNNDQTTEPLSPRLIDRTSVIKLPKIDEKFDESKINVKTDLTWDALLENINTYANAVAKGANDANNNANEIGNDKKAITMEDVYEAFESHNLPVSRRIKNRIEVYLKVAVGDFKIDKDKAVDFAIAQNLLPKINGFCEEYRDLYTALTENVNDNYPLTYAFLQKLSKMLGEGTNEYIQYTSI